MNTILAFATGYKVDQYADFLNSLKKIIQPFKLVLFTDLTQSDFNQWPFCEVVNIKDDNYTDINTPVIAAVIRYYYYQRYLSSLTTDDPVLFCDVRDVIFQNGNVFDNLSSEKIYVFKENNRYTFGKCECHTDWYTKIDRLDFINKFSTETFYCSGVQLFGSVKSCLHYLYKFIDVCESYIDHTFYINDQTIHNILIYENHIDNHNIYRYESELNDKVFSMGLCREEDYTIVDKKLKLSNTDVYPSIVHQYDRRIGRTKDLL